MGVMWWPKYLPLPYKTISNGFPGCIHESVRKEIHPDKSSNASLEPTFFKKNRYHQKQTAQSPESFILFLQMNSPIYLPGDCPDHHAAVLSRQRGCHIFTVPGRAINLLENKAEGNSKTKCKLPAHSLLTRLSFPRWTAQRKATPVLRNVHPFHAFSILLCQDRQWGYLKNTGWLPCF